MKVGASTKGVFFSIRILVYLAVILLITLPLAVYVAYTNHGVSLSSLFLPPTLKQKALEKVEQAQELTQELERQVGG